MADWKSFSVTIPGKELLDPIRQVLETLMIFLDILKTILETIKLFLIDFGNPIKALVEALIGLLIEIIESLRATGVYAYFDIPDPINDPNFARVSGGFSGFLERFKGSLYDTKDFNRPQPRDATTSGFVFLVCDAENIFLLIALIKALLRFFGKAFTSPRYEAPTDFKAIPVGAEGDPILAVASVFTKGPIEAIQIQWSLPSTVASPDPGFSDVVSATVSEFVPPNFLIERSTDINPASQKIDIGELGSSESVGLTEVDAPVLVDFKLASRFSKLDGTTVLARQVLRDEQYEPFIKFQKYIKVPVGSDVLGVLLGTFRYIDTDVEVGKIYYYRIRAYSGDLNVNDSGTISGLPTSYGALKAGTAGNVKGRFLEWPKSGSEDIVMGKPSGIIRATVPPDLGDFDVYENLRRVFQTAFSLDFHLPMSLETPEGPPPQFDAQGAPIPPTPANFVGKGSLTYAAGILANFQGQLLLDKVAGLDSPSQAFDDQALQGLSMPWQRFNVRRNSLRLTEGVASAMLQLGGGEVLTFRDLMRGPLPRGPINSQGNLSGKTTMEAIVFAFTEPTDEEENNEQVLTTYVAAYEDVKLRQNLLVIINFLKNFTLGGVPPDWISINPLRDIIPWASQLLYDILDKIQALLDAFQGFLDEIIKFIENLERKIDALEKFIQFLLDILDFIEDLTFSVFLLAANGISGDASAWIAEIDAAQNAPTSGPGSYTAGIVLAYVLVDAGAIVTAFSLIFGG